MRQTGRYRPWSEYVPLPAHVERALLDEDERRAREAGEES
jgi:hypothetical protein